MNTLSAFAALAPTYGVCCGTRPIPIRSGRRVNPRIVKAVALLEALPPRIFMQSARS